MSFTQKGNLGCVRPIMQDSRGAFMPKFFLADGHLQGIV